jgi:hypothetical protein
MNSGRKLVVAAVAALGLLIGVPAAANAAVTASITGDTGAPVALAPGAPPAQIANMSVTAAVHVDTGDAKSWSYTVTDSNGVGAATPSICEITRFDGTDDHTLVDYHGNLGYTLTVSLFADDNCLAPKGTQSFSWNVAAGVSFNPPAGPLPMRSAGSLETNTQNFVLNGAPGAETYDVQYALNGTVNPDGSLGGNVQTGYRDPTTGIVGLLLNHPGKWLVVARARTDTGATAWTPPMAVQIYEPFDLSSLIFNDASGPGYRVKVTFNDTTLAKSKVTVAIAKGKKGGKFKTVGKPKVTSKGSFQQRFTEHGTGYYRIRISFSGNSLVKRGSVTKTFRLTRSLIHL